MADLRVVPEESGAPTTTTLHPIRLKGSIASASNATIVPVPSTARDRGGSAGAKYDLPTFDNMVGPGRIAGSA